MDSQTYDDYDSTGHPSADEVRRRFGTNDKNPPANLQLEDLVREVRLILNHSSIIILSELRRIRELKDKGKRMREYDKYRKGLLGHIRFNITTRVLGSNNPSAQLSAAQKDQVEEAMRYAKRRLTQQMRQAHQKISSRQAAEQAAANTTARADAAERSATSGASRG